MLVDNLFTNLYCLTKIRKIDGVKVSISVININIFRQFSTVFWRKLFNITSLRISLHAGLYITIKFRSRLLPPPSQIRQSNTWCCKQITPNTERH